MATPLSATLSLSNPLSLLSHLVSLSHPHHLTTGTPRSLSSFKTPKDPSSRPKPTKAPHLHPSIADSTEIGHKDPSPPNPQRYSDSTEIPSIEMPSI
ncbi:hypothetical protein SLA2020_265740 [Shorea laevis]